MSLDSLTSQMLSLCGGDMDQCLTEFKKNIKDLSGKKLPPLELVEEEDSPPTAPPSPVPDSPRTAPPSPTPPQCLANDWFEEHSHDITGNTWSNDNGWMSMCIAGGGEHACYVQCKRNLYTHEWEMRLNYPIRKEIKKIDCVYNIYYDTGGQGLVFENPPLYCYQHNPDIYKVDWDELYRVVYDDGDNATGEASPYDNVNIKQIIKDSDIPMLELHALQKLIVDKLKEGRKKKTEDNKKEFKIGDNVKIYDCETDKEYGAGTLEDIKNSRCVVKLYNGGLARIPICFLIAPTGYH